MSFPLFSEPFMACREKWARRIATERGLDYSESMLSWREVVNRAVGEAMGLPEGELPPPGCYLTVSAE